GSRGDRPRDPGGWWEGARLRAPGPQAGRPACGADPRAGRRARGQRGARREGAPLPGRSRRGLGEAADDERLDADRRCAARPRLSARGGEGRSDPRPHGRPARAPGRGAGAADRLPARGSGRGRGRVQELMLEPDVETRSWDEQLAIDDESYRAQLAYLLERSPFYRAKLAGAEGGGLAGIADLPLTDKAELRATRKP